MFHHIISYIKGSKHVSCCFTCSREDDKAVTFEEARPGYQQSTSEWQQAEDGPELPQVCPVLALSFLLCRE